MLAPLDLELLTGFVDGELSAADHRRAEQLLTTNGEARATLQRLQADAHALRHLPRVAAPIDFTVKVLGTLAQDGARPARRSRPPVSPVPRAVPVWVGFAAAAAVLLAIGVGSFLVHSAGDPAEGGPTASVARRPADPIVTLPIIPPVEDRQTREVAKSTPPAAEPLHGPTLETPPFRDDGDDEAVTRPMGDTGTMPPAGPVLGAAGSEAASGLERVEVTLPQVFSIHRLDQSDAAAALGDQLGKGSAFRVELLARDATRGFDRLRAAFAGLKVHLLYDPAAQARLKKPGWKTDYAVFVENVTAAEAVHLLRVAGVADRQAGKKKASEQRFDGPLVVKPVGRVDRRELYDLFGVDVIRTRPAAMLPKVDPDIRRPLTDQTGELVKATLEGKGLARPGHESRTGYVAPLGGPRTRSTELKRFLDARRPAAPGTLQLLFVLRTVG
ncbi:MAG: hypothetical protein U0736_09630 [Gemmataceae bacterium]